MRKRLRSGSLLKFQQFCFGRVCKEIQVKLQIKIYKPTAYPTKNLYYIIHIKLISKP